MNNETQLDAVQAAHAEIMMDLVLVMGGLFLTPVLIVFTVMFFKSRAHRASMEALRALAASGTSVTPELVQSLGIRARPPYANLRTGLIWIAVGLGLCVAGLSADEAEPGAWAIAALPGLVGAVYVGLWALIDRKAG